MKNEQEKSDPSIVAKKPANKPDITEIDLWGSGAESMEPRETRESNTRAGHRVVLQLWNRRQVVAISL
jgi:hypothetical protein